MLEIQFSNFFKQFIPEAVLINCKLSLYYIIEANNTDNYIAIHPELFFSSSCRQDETRRCIPMYRFTHSSHLVHTKATNRYLFVKKV